MKIGIICPNYPPAVFEGGISHYSRLLAEGLHARGHAVYALTSTEFAGLMSERESSDRIKIMPIKGPWRYQTVSEIEAISKKMRLEVVILQFSPASFNRSFRVAWGLAHLGCQKVTAFHTLWGKGIDRAMGLLTLLGSEKIIATNSEVMFLLERYLPRFLSKTYWIPIGSNILPCSRTDRVDPPSARPLMTYFGMLYPGKGLDLILNCLQEIKKKGHLFEFKFIGGGMPGHAAYEENVQSQITARSLGDDVQLLGLIPDKEVSHWLSRSRFVFLPYDRGLSDRRGTLMAALAHGKAVLTSPPVVHMPCFKNGMNICWPNSHSTEEYLALLERLLLDDKLILRLEAGARHLSTLFDWGRIVSEYELVLHHP